MKLKVPIQGMSAFALRHRLANTVANVADNILFDPPLASAAEVGVDTIAIELSQVVAG